eukprot:m.262668 g.262668  ORF g.262668 m.262668 type:complete len:127 (-) comp54624_c0_seq18:528-908(-)
MRGISSLYRALYLPIYLSHSASYPHEQDLCVLIPHIAKCANLTDFWLEGIPLKVISSLSMLSGCHRLRTIIIEHTMVRGVRSLLEALSHCPELVETTSLTTRTALRCLGLLRWQAELLARERQSAD